MNSLRKIRHTIINMILIAMIVLLNYVMSLGTSAIPAFGEDIQYRTSDKNSIALECVVAWDGQYVQHILDILCEENVRLTFVLSGEWARKNPDTLKKIVENGHDIVTCGMNYSDTDNLNADKLSESIRISAQLIESLSGKRVEKYFCPTYNTAKAMKAASKASMKCLRCTTDLLAGRGDEKAILERARNNVSASSIVSFTPTLAMTKALPELLAVYRDAGLKVTAVT